MPLQSWVTGEVPSLISTPEEDSSSRKMKTFQTPNQKECNHRDKICTGHQEITPPPPPTPVPPTSESLTFFPSIPTAPRELSRVLVLKRFRAWTRSFLPSVWGRAAPGIRFPISTVFQFSSSLFGFGGAEAFARPGAHSELVPGGGFWGKSVAGPSC